MRRVDSSVHRIPFRVLWHFLFAPNQRSPILPLIIVKKWFIIFIVVLLAAGGAWFWRGRDAVVESPGKPARSTTAIVESRDIHFAINAAGEIGPADQVSVRPEVNGRILELAPKFWKQTLEHADTRQRLDDSVWSRMHRPAPS